MTDSEKKFDQATVMAELKDMLRSMLILLESSPDHPLSENEQQRLMKALQEFKRFKSDDRRRHPRKGCRLAITVSDDRRRHPRKSCRIPITAGVLRIFSEIANNISNGGLFIHTSSSFSPGETLSLILSPPNRNKPVKISGKVVRKTREGVGVEFTTPLDEELKKIIESL